MSGVETLTIAAEEADVRLDRWFKKRFPGLSHGRLEKLLRTGQIRVDGRRAKAGQRLAPGSRVRVPPLPEAAEEARRRPAPPASAEDLAQVENWVIYRDKHLLAINKPAGLAVQGGSGVTRHLDALLDGLKFDAPERPRLVHRLDKDTSGVLLLARDAATARSLAELFRGKKLRKLYWALTVGAPAPERGRIDAALAKKTVAAGAERVVPAEEGAEAVTFYATLDAAGDKLAWLALLPLTGRTHQLRAHCAEILGCPIFGDRKYPAPADTAAGAGLGAGLHLHARALSLPHPSASGTRRATLELSAPLPPHMMRSWRHLGFDPAAAGSDPFAELAL
jgi:23S rRNA pseudouridine955/2504/2580 synthase